LKRSSAKTRLFQVSFLPNIPIIIALIILAFAPFFILNNEEGISNTTAGYALYLIIIGVLGKIILFLTIKQPAENN
jgi:hypothetical protein